MKIIINNFNRMTYLQRLLTWLWSAGHSDITILDNNSTYPPLLGFYQLIEKDVKIIRMEENIGPWALWHSRNRHLVEPPFVYTDPDVVPAESCSLNIVEMLHEIAQKYSKEVCKVGPGLDIRDIPDRYSQKKYVVNWESQFWPDSFADYKGIPLYRAAIDTSFAVYTRGDFSKEAIRMGYPNVVKHLPWYIHSENPKEEDVYYEERSQKFLLGWHINTCTPYAVDHYNRTRK